MAIKISLKWGYQLSLLRPIYFAPLSSQFAQISFAAPDDVLFSKEKNIHMQSVNMYLWYKEENDFHFVIKRSLIVEGKQTDSWYFHGRSISFLEHIFIQVANILLWKKVFYWEIQNDSIVNEITCICFMLLQYCNSIKVRYVNRIRQ